MSGGSGHDNHGLSSTDSLTPLGREAAERLLPLLAWAVEHMPELVAARERHEGR
ncbi:hypothetical protein [Microbispora bryophytorum]|uniref:hypothetical protein n=1 Tax=Microbispora bryophytorum TaxID=1460882 RepID=UPI0033C5016B